MTELKDELHIGSFEKSEQRIHPELPMDSSIIEESSRGSVQNIVDHPLEFVEVPGMKIARLPLGPKKEHLDGMVEAGKLDAGNIFVGEMAWKSIEIKKRVPQVFGYTITRDKELARIITDKKTLDKARKEVEITGTFPTIYLLNHEACLAYAAYLEGRVPFQEEQNSIWEKIPGDSVLEKATSAGIPFVGCFDADKCKPADIGTWACLLSQTVTFRSMIKNLLLGRENLYVDEYSFNREHGFSCLVMFD